MKKTLLRSIFAAIAICFSLTTNAQGIWIEMGNIMEQFYEGDDVMIPIKISDYSGLEALPNDLLVTFNQVADIKYALNDTDTPTEQLSITGTQINNAPTIWGEKYLTVYACFTLPVPADGYEDGMAVFSKIIPDPTPSNNGNIAVENDPLRIQVIYSPKTPSLQVDGPFTSISGSSSKPVYKGVLYKTEISLTHQFLTNNIELSSTSSDVTFPENKTIYTLDEVEALNDYLPVNIQPSATGQQSWTIKVTCGALEKEVTISANVVEPKPIITLGTATNLNDLYVGDELVKKITLTWNQFTTEEIVLSKLTDSITSFSPEKISKETLAEKIAEGVFSQDITVTIKPTLVADGHQYFYLKAESTGAETVYGYVRQNDAVLAKNPAILKFSTNGAQDSDGYEALKPFTLMNPLNIAVNLFTEGDIEFSVDAAHAAEVNFGDQKKIAVTDLTLNTAVQQRLLNGISPVITPVNTALDEDGKHVASETRTYTFTATNTGTDNPAPAVSFEVEVLILGVNSGTTALENATVAGQATKIMENGQIFIIRDGVRYNILGTVVK